MTQNYQNLPRTVVLLRMAWRCSFCIFAVVVGNVVLMAVPQAREAMRLSAAETNGLLDTRSVFYIGAVLYWAITSWFVARLLLSRNFPRDTIGAPKGNPFADWVTVVLPRGLALLATLPICLLTLQTNLLLGLFTSGASMVFIMALVMRTRFGDVKDKHAWRDFNVLGPASRQAMLGLLAFSLVLLAGLWNVGAGRLTALIWLLAAIALRLWDGRACGLVAKWVERRETWLMLGLNLGWALASGVLLMRVDDEIDLARTLASPAVLLFALGSWTLFGGLVFTYWPLTRDWLTLATWLPLLLYLLGSLRETHWVAQRELAAPQAQASASADDWRLKREALEERFQAWLGRLPAGQPVYFAALAGGASRAAYWSGSVLARLEDEARQLDSRFAENLFAVSSISGGSLGATAFVADLAQFPPDKAGGPPAAASGTAVGAVTSRWGRVTTFLRSDFLSPVVARMLFPDLAIRFWPQPLPLPFGLGESADRSLGLEKAWALDWQHHFGKPGPAVDWRRPLTEMYSLGEPDGVPRLPTLLLNTVRLEDGQRFMQSNVKLQLPGVMDLLDVAFDTQRLTLAQAVHNSARFPYVSPSGMVLGAHDDPGESPRIGRLGDGGYHEASGAATLSDLLEALIRKGLLRHTDDGQSLLACPAGWTKPQAGQPQACPGPTSQVVALILDSEPAIYPGSHVRTLEGMQASSPAGIAQGAMLLPELLGPVFGGLSTRTELARESQYRLSRLVGTRPWALIELRMPLWQSTQDETHGVKACKGRHDQPSMNWALDDCSLERLGAASVDVAVSDSAGRQPTRTLADTSLQGNLAHLRGLIRKASQKTEAR